MLRGGERFFLGIVPTPQRLAGPSSDKRTKMAVKPISARISTHVVHTHPPPPPAAAAAYEQFPSWSWFSDIQRRRRSISSSQKTTVISFFICPWTWWEDSKTCSPLGCGNIPTPTISSSSDSDDSILFSQQQLECAFCGETGQLISIQVSNVTTVSNLRHVSQIFLFYFLLECLTFQSSQVCGMVLLLGCLESLQKQK